MEALIDNVFRNTVKSNKGRLVERSFYEDFMGFIHAIDWTEPMVVGILAFHVSVLLLVVVTRNNVNIQMGILCCACAMLYLSQYFNTYARDHWEELGFTQNYFDKRGVFMSFVYSVPQLVITGFQLVYALTVSCRLLVKVKRAEFIQQRRAAAEAKGATSENPAVNSESKKTK